MPKRSLSFYSFRAALRDLKRMFPYHCTASLFIQSPESLVRKLGRDSHEPRISNFRRSLSFIHTVLVNVLLWRMSALPHRLLFVWDEGNFRLFALRRQDRDNKPLTCIDCTANSAMQYLIRRNLKPTKQDHQMF